MKANEWGQWVLLGISAGFVALIVLDLGLAKYERHLLAGEYRALHGETIKIGATVMTLNNIQIERGEQ